MKIIKLLAIIFLLGIISLVVSQSVCFAKLALKKGQDKIELSEESIALVSVKVSNQQKPEYQLKVTTAYFLRDSNNTENKTFSLGSFPDPSPSPFKTEEKSYNVFLLSFLLKPGDYIFKQILCNTPEVYGALCQIPLNAKVTIKPNSINYLGNIETVLRKRTNDEEVRAVAGAVGLLGLAVSGFSTGTFDVTIKDNFDEDIKDFMSEYPVLQKYKIEKSILPPWIRPEKINKTN